MSKSARKILIFFSIILFALLLSSAMPLIKHAYAEDGVSHPITRADETVAPDPADTAKPYDGKEYMPTRALYTVTKIVDLSSNTVVTSAVNVGEYEFTVIPAENCVWSDDSKSEKQFILTINKAVLNWYHNNFKVSEDYKEIVYSLTSPADQIPLIRAQSVDLRFAFSVIKDNNMTVTKDGQEVTQAIDVGEYVFTIDDVESFENPVFTLKITPAEINEPKTEMVYKGQAWAIDNAHYYNLQKIEDGEGNDVTKDGAVDAGDYTLTVSPTSNYIWTDGTADAKQFTLTIKQAVIRWFYGVNPVQDENEQLVNYKTVEFSNVDYYRQIQAKGITTYDVSGFGGLVAIDNSTGREARKVTDVGEYTFKLVEKHESIHLYKNYINPEFKLTITIRKTNIGTFTNLQWIAGGGGRNSLATGRVYEYSYQLGGETKTAYMTQKIDDAPFAEWQNWTYIDETDVKLAILAYSDDNSICLNETSFTAKYTSFTAEHIGIEKIKQSGKYVTEAVIKARPNYELYYEPNGTLNVDNVEDLGDGTYKITKTWYVAYYVNEFLDKSSADGGEKVEFEFTKAWAFGAFPEDGVSYPYAAHGDERKVTKFNQPEGYTLYAYKGDELVNIDNADDWDSDLDDIVTFTLKSGDKVICENQPRTKYDYYINRYTPVGKYTIEFTLKTVSFGSAPHNDWWHGQGAPSCGREYLGIFRSYDFEVTTGTLQFDDTALNFNQNDELQPFKVNLKAVKDDYANFFAVAKENIVFTDAITKDAVIESNTYWATVADEYYGNIVITYKLMGIDDETYYDEGATVWDGRITKEATYSVYYKISLANYYGVPAADQLSEKYFTIEVYSTVNVGLIILFVAIGVIVIAAAVLLVLFFIKRKKGGNGKDDAVQLEIADLGDTEGDGEQPAQADEQETLRENPDEVQQTIEDVLSPATDAAAEEIEPEKAEEPVAEEIQPVETEEPVTEEIQPVETEEPVAEEILPEETEEPVAEEILPEETEEPVAEEILPVETVEPVTEDVKPVEMQAVVTENLEEPTDVAFDEPAETEQPEIAERPIETPSAASEEVQSEEPVQHVEEPAQPEPAAEQEQPAEDDFSAEREYIDEIMAEANADYEEMQEAAAKEREEKGENGDGKGE